MMKYVSVGLLLRRSTLNWFQEHLTFIGKKKKIEEGAFQENFMRFFRKTNNYVKVHFNPRLFFVRNSKSLLVIADQSVL